MASIAALLETIGWMKDGFANGQDVVAYIQTCLKGLGGPRFWFFR